MEDYKKFKKEVDKWVKNLNKRLTKLEDKNAIITEMNDNIDFNYELICELKANVESLHQEISAMRLIQIISLQKEVN